MKPITPPLRIGDEGPEVANLQEALVLLINRQVIQVDPATRQELLQMLADDRQARQYRDGTAKLVDIFQHQHHLHTTAEVDPLTADALNAALKDLGASDTPPQDIQKRVVTGQVTQDDQAKFHGTVILFHEGDSGSIRLGQDVTGEDGTYTIRYEPLPDVDAINARVSAVDGDGRTAQSSDVVREADPVQVINLVVPVVQPEAATQRVEGRVVFDHGAPAAGLTLRLYRLGFGGAEGATRLAETTVLEHGVYGLPYAVDGQAANLEVRAVDQAGNEVRCRRSSRTRASARCSISSRPPAARPLARSSRA